MPVQTISLREMLQRGIALIESSQLDRAHQLFSSCWRSIRINPMP